MENQIFRSFFIYFGKFWESMGGYGRVWEGMGGYGGDCRHAGAAVLVAANAVKPWQYCMWRLSDGSDKSDLSDGYCRLLLQYCVWASGHYPRVARRSSASTGCSGLCPLPNSSQTLPILPKSIVRQAGVSVTTTYSLPLLAPPQADFTQSALLTATV